MPQQKDTSLRSKLSPSRKEGGNMHDGQTSVMSNLSPSHREGGKRA